MAHLNDDSLRQYVDAKGAVTALNKNIASIQLKQEQSFTRVDVSKNELTSCLFTENIPLVTWLNLSHNQIKKTKPLRLLSSLTVLTASHNQIEKMVFIAKLQGLKAIVLNNNLLSECPPLSMPLLNTLVLSNNSLETIDVSGLPSLAKLSISHNQLTEFPDVTKNKHLKAILMNSNSIQKIHEGRVGLSNMRLETIELGKNNIQKFRSLKALHILRVLRKLNLAGNPVCEKDDFQAKTLLICTRLVRLNDRPPTLPLKTAVPTKSAADTPAADKIIGTTEMSDDEEKSETPEQPKEKKPKLSKAARKLAAKKESGVVAIREIRKKKTNTVSVEDMLGGSGDIGTGQGPGW